MQAGGDKRLAAAFLATAYRIETPQGGFELRIGIEHPSFNAFLMDQGVAHWAVLTAWNPGAEKCPVGENGRAQIALLARIDERAYGRYPARNCADDGQWPVEESVLVLGMGREEACQLAAEFGQRACVTGRTNGVPELSWVGEQCGE